MINGERIILSRWIEGGSVHGSFVVRVQVEAIVPDDDPSDPCFEPQALKLLDEAQRLADAGDIDALAKLGDVYIRRSA